MTPIIVYQVKSFHKFKYAANTHVPNYSEHFQDRGSLNPVWRSLSLLSPLSEIWLFQMQRASLPRQNGV